MTDYKIILNPGESLESSRLTSTAYVGTSAAMEPQVTHSGFKDNLRVVPNPYNIRSEIMVIPIIQEMLKIINCYLLDYRVNVL